jgi:hypothetical protein
MFRNICGNDALKNVVLATTFWNDIDPSVGERRERELSDSQSPWGKMIALGASIMRLGLDKESAMRLLKELSTKPKVVLAAQLQMDSQPPVPQRISLVENVSSPTSGLDEASQWYQAKLQQQREERERWHDALNEMKTKIESQTEQLEKTKAETVRQQSLIEKKRKQRAKMYESHKCRCKFVGRPRCASCSRVVTNIFYRKWPNSFRMIY